MNPIPTEDVELMLHQRCRWWSSIKLKLVQRLLLAGIMSLFQSQGGWRNGKKFLPAKSEIAGSSPALVFRFEGNKCFFPAHS